MTADTPPHIGLHLSVKATTRGIIVTRLLAILSCDHFHPPCPFSESPFEAYRDVATVLDVIAAALGKTRADLRIYDPYYCSGRVVEHLASLGFLQVSLRWWCNGDRGTSRGMFCNCDAEMRKIKDAVHSAATSIGPGTLSPRCTTSARISMPWWQRAACQNTMPW